MRINRLGHVRVVEVEKCDICNKKVGEQHNHKDDRDFLLIDCFWGYSSNKDQQYHECVVCYECWDKVDAFISKIGGKVRKYRYDMLSGDIVGDYAKEVERVKKENAMHKASKIQRSNKTRKAKR